MTLTNVPSPALMCCLPGNKFYESPSPIGAHVRHLQLADFSEPSLLSYIDPERTKRTVQYRNPEDVWNYIGGGKRLASGYFPPYFTLK